MYGLGKILSLKMIAVQFGTYFLATVQACVFALIISCFLDFAMLNIHITLLSSHWYLESEKYMSSNLSWQNTVHVSAKSHFWENCLSDRVQIFGHQVTGTGVFFFHVTIYTFTLYWSLSRNLGRLTWVRLQQPQSSTTQSDKCMLGLFIFP